MIELSDQRTALLGEQRLVRRSPMHEDQQSNPLCRVNFVIKEFFAKICMSISVLTVMSCEVQLVLWVVDEGVPSESEEERKLLEARAAKMRQIIGEDSLEYYETAGELSPCAVQCARCTSGCEKNCCCQNTGKWKTSFVCCRCSAQEGHRDSELL